LPVQPAYAVSPDIVISQVYGEGTSDATYKNDFIELYHRGATPRFSGLLIYDSQPGDAEFAPATTPLGSGKIMLD